MQYISSNRPRGKRICQQVIMTVHHLIRTLRGLLLQSSTLIPGAISFSTSDWKETERWRRTGTCSFFSEVIKERECQGSEVILCSVNTSERQGKKAETSSPCTKVLQGDNNYFLLPSSVSLSAAPSLETLYGTHRSKTKHERKGSESVRQKEYDV